MAIQPLNVAGGWRMADHVWERTLDGWDCDYDTTDLDPTIYLTEQDCREAIEDQHPRITDDRSAPAPVQQPAAG